MVEPAPGWGTSSGLKATHANELDPKYASYLTSELSILRQKPAPSTTGNTPTWVSAGKS